MQETCRKSLIQKNSISFGRGSDTVGGDFQMQTSEVFKTSEVFFFKTSEVFFSAAPELAEGSGCFFTFHILKQRICLGHELLICEMLEGNGFPGAF